MAASPGSNTQTDERAYARLANHFIKEKNLDPPRMDDPVRWGPAAPVAFAVALRFKPSQRTVGDVPPAYAAQALFGTLLIPAVFVLAALLGNWLVGLLSAAAVALYPPLILTAGDLLSEPLGALLLACALSATVLALRRPSRQRSAAAGVLIGLTVLARVDMLALPLLAGVGLLVAAWHAHGPRPARSATMALLAGALAVLAPWSAYASHVKGSFVLVTSGGASNLFMGTYLPGDGRLYGVKEALADEARERYPEYRGQGYDQIPQRRILDTVAARYPTLDREAALYRATRANLRDYLLGDPLAFAAMMLRKVERMWWSPSRGAGRPREAWWRLIHVPLLAIGVLGLLAGLHAHRWRHAGLWLLALLLLYATARDALLVAEARHNLPLMPVMIVAGVVGLAHARRQHASTAAAATVPREA